MSLIVALSCSANTGFGQTTDLDDDDEIVLLDEFVVTGIKESLVQAVEIKRDAPQMLDVILAEDIGKFPDNNVVEALQRVSGIQTTDRGAGEVSTVSIRGLNDVTTTINGRNIFTASGRSVALQDIPASLLNRVDVYKTRSSDLIETGIAGVIDIHTQRPFNFDGSRTVLAGRMIYSDQPDKWNPTLSALFSNTWETGNGGKFGALFNVSYTETDYRDESITAGAMVPFMSANPATGYTPFQRIFPDGPGAVFDENGVLVEALWQAGLEAGLPSAEGSTLTIPATGETYEYVLARDAIFQSDYTGHRERPAANLSLQWAPDENSTYTFEAFYNGYRNESFNDLFFSFADWWGSLGDDPASNIEIYPGTNIVKSRQDIGFPYGFTSGDLTVGKTDSYLYALGGDWDIGDNLNIVSELVYQDSTFETEFLAMRAERVHYMLDVDFNAGGGIPAFGFEDDPNTADVDESDMTDPRLWTVAQLYDNANKFEGDALTWTIDGEWMPDSNFFQSVKFGYRYDDRSAAEYQRTGSDAALGQPLTNFPDLQYVNDDFFHGRSDVPTSWVVPNGHYLYENADYFRELWGYPTSDELFLQQSFDINETTQALYAVADWATNIGDRVLDGQIGLRYVNVETGMTFWDLNSGDVGTADVNTADVLPSFTARYRFADNWSLRASYGETLRRPGFNQLNPMINYVEDVTDIGYGTATGGNPDLDPTTSKNYDLSLEYYFADAGSIYATAFKREVDGLVIDFARRVTFEGYDYILTQPDNASNGKLDGFEFGLVWFPEGLPDILDGFGLQASYTMLDSSQDIPVTNEAGEIIGTDTTPFFGVSDTSYSVVLAYEKSKFAVRLSYVWREDFLNNYEARQFANPLGVYRNPEESMDLQFTYNVSDDFAITLDATNLTDQVYQSYYEYPDTNNFGSSIYSRTIAVAAPGGRRSSWNG